MNPTPDQPYDDGTVDDDIDNNDHHNNNPPLTSDNHNNTNHHPTAVIRNNKTNYWSFRRIVTIILFICMILLQYCIYILQQHKTTLLLLLQQQQQQSNTNDDNSNTTTTTTDSSTSTVTAVISSSSSSVSYTNQTMNHSEVLLYWDNHYDPTSSSLTRSRSHHFSSSSTYSTTSVQYMKDLYWQRLWYLSSTHLDLSHYRRILDTDLVNPTLSSSSSLVHTITDSSSHNNPIMSSTSTMQSGGGPTTSQSTAVSLLRHAAHQGHSTAQYLLGNAYMSGFYYYFDTSTTIMINTAAHQQQNTTTITTSKNNSNNNPLFVTEDWWYTPPLQSPTEMDSPGTGAVDHNSILVASLQEQQQQQQYQQARGMLLYQMAAIGGNVDAMITLGHRIEEQIFTSSSSSSSSKSSTGGGSSSSTASELSTCQRSIPYHAQAAHHIIDTLMNDIYSRGQITPFQDKHVLYKIHVHGGNYPTTTTMSAQDIDHNKPYESMETIQFYKIKALPLLQQQQNQQPSSSYFSWKKWWKATASKEDSNNQDATATAAAYTLGRWYHIGARGLSPNVTMALQYYVAAAQAGHWEAAGQAGFLYFYNIGFDVAAPTTTTTSSKIKQNDALIQTNRAEAYRYFQLGAPHELSGCLLRYQLKLAQQQQKLAGQVPQNPDRIFPCDSESLNGLGLIHLFGLSSHNISINIPLATRYFELARDQGNSNAAYHLAMMKLGWRTHYNINNNNNHTTEDVENDVKLLDIDNGIDDDVLSRSGMIRKKAELLFPLKTAKNDENAKQVDNRTLSVLEYKAILTDLSNAAKGGHLLARHRLAMIYEQGIRLPSETKDANESNEDTKKRSRQKYILAPECEIANMHYKWILDHASPMKGQRMRKAYLHYMAGNYKDSLRYYLYVADMGYEIAQLNAAFLLEQGVCLGLNDVDCAKASVRLWKVVAKRDHAEANMRVGDFYYYGRFRTSNDRPGGGTNSIPVGPWGWIDYFIYPEKHLLPLLWNEFKRQVINFSVWEPLSILDVSRKNSDVVSSHKESLNAGERTCSADNDEGTCLVPGKNSDSSIDTESGKRRRQQQLDDDLATAAQYYQLAADMTGTARAHFNIGFMYEWGLGLKQDFPLAKRQYDLAITSSGHNREADLPILIALTALSVHEYVVKLKLSFDRYWHRSDVNDHSANKDQIKVE